MKNILVLAFIIQQITLNPFDNGGILCLILILILIKLLIYIPENKIIPEKGYFSKNDFVNLLRKYCKNSNVVYFLADMLEE
ncbi:hypothetical protein SAMN05443428_12819 [Caloramator quimbayensis]|uniref:Uncharacterized protein n=1 Tax=Caloramator quimbayensis TaxID=1147123 RepID=A0A1T4Y8Y2_9CLOT|nr:hypothetical protein [Caloramator quimbayensis]SKA98304.1 hypothetical protein SAMN05443428_12819 [Caloramator quimbayensis]